jgi:hypothetical protein
LDDPFNRWAAKVVGKKMFKEKRWFGFIKEDLTVLARVYIGKLNCCGQID